MNVTSQAWWTADLTTAGISLFINPLLLLCKSSCLGIPQKLTDSHEQEYSAFLSPSLLMTAFWNSTWFSESLYPSHFQLVMVSPIEEHWRWSWTVGTWHRGTWIEGTVGMGLGWTWRPYGSFQPEWFCRMAASKSEGIFPEWPSWPRRWGVTLMRAKGHKSVSLSKESSNGSRKVPVLQDDLILRGKK